MPSPSLRAQDRVFVISSQWQTSLHPEYSSHLILSQCPKVMLALEIWAVIGGPMFLGSRDCRHLGPNPWCFHGAVEFLRVPEDTIGVSFSWLN